MNRSRRSFVAASAAAITAPYFIPARALGKDGEVAPSNRVAMAYIGVGNQGTNNLIQFLNDDRIQHVAVCDVDSGYRDGALARCKLPAAAGFKDFREVIARKDIDALLIATPDHWHGVIACAAARAGKDMYCEKPLSLSIAEGRTVADTVTRHNRVLQMGTWRRSRGACRRTCEMVRNGRLGKVHTVRIGLPAKFVIAHGYTGSEPFQTPPATLDYDMWLGPCPEKPYTPARCHFNFRWINDYSSAYITDWGAHFMDIAHWGLGMDDSGPVEVSAKGSFAKIGIYDGPLSYEIEYTYPGGAKVLMYTTTEEKEWGMKFEGDKGWAFVSDGTIVAEPRELIAYKPGENEIHLYESPDHHRNFIDCVLNRKPTAATAEIGHRSATACHLAFIALTTGRKIKWDAKAEKIVGDDAASAMLSRPMRAPWKLGA